MEKPNKRERLHGDSVYAVTSQWHTAVVRLAQTIRFHDRKLASGPALNGVVLAFLSLPKDEQQRFLASGMRKYETLTTGAGGDTPVADGTAKKKPTRK